MEQPFVLKEKIKSQGKINNINIYSGDEYEYVEKDSVIGAIVSLINNWRKFCGMTNKEGDFDYIIKTALVLFFLSGLNGLIGNYFTLFLLVNGYFAYTYLYANKKDMMDKYCAKAKEGVDKVLNLIPKYNDGIKQE